MSSQTLQQADGALNLRKLHKELARALEDDVADKREDAAKKRAVRTARSYDEFRHRVACAHLKPLGRRDIDSLGRPKQGWSGGSGARSAPQQQQQPDTAAPSPFPFTTISLAAPCNGTAPATAAAFEKEWRRLRMQGKQGSAACIALLQSAGGAGFIKRRLSSGDLGPDLLGEMVEALMDATVAEPQPSSEEGATTTAAGGMTTRTLSHEEALACLDALAGTPRFALHRALLARGQRTAATELVAAIVEAGGDGGKDAAALARVQKAYCA